MLAKAMEESRSIPTATSFRTLAVDTLDAKRKALNGVLKERGMKVSFTHLIAWAIVKAAQEWPAMARHFEEARRQADVVEPGGVNLGIAVDVERKGQRSLMVPCIKGADALDFKGFHTYYEELITKTRENKLTARRLPGDQHRLTNPGGLGTIASVPRLMTGQGTIVACGSLAYPVEWAHAPADKVKALGVSKVMTMTSTSTTDNPGSGVRVIPAADRGAAPGRGRVLRVGGARPRRGRRRRHRPTPPPPPRPPLAGGRAPRAAAARSPTPTCCRPSRRPPRCSRPTEPTATWPPASTRSARSPRATRRSSPRTST